MTFLNPLVLFGIIAAGVPVLIHLLQLKKLRQVEFSSIRFLKEIQHASAKKVKLRDYLLLLLRVLAIASLVVAFSRPALKGIGDNNSKTASVIIVDDSPSTTARNEYGEIFSQLKTAASGLVNEFNVGDDASLILLSQLNQPGRGDTSQISSTINPHFLLPSVSRAEPSNIKVMYASAIEAALNRLESSNYVNKDIYLLGDLQRTEFKEQTENGGISNRREIASPEKANVRLFLLQTNEAADNNLSISNVKLSDPVVEINSPSEVQASIVNNGDAEKSGVVASLYLDNRKVAQSVADLPPRSSRTVNLALNVSAGGFHNGVVEIDDNSIQSDNKFYFSFFAIKSLNVVVVTSKQENDFVLSAVNAVTDTSTGVAVNVVTPDQLIFSNLSNADVVVVEEYAASQSFGEKVSRFVRNGGGVILFAPVSPQSGFFNEILGAMNIGRTARSFSSNGGNFLSIDKIDAGDNFSRDCFPQGGAQKK